MADHTNEFVVELMELSCAEMAQVQGGAVVDYFLKLEGIVGESTDDKHR